MVEWGVKQVTGVYRAYQGMGVCHVFVNNANYCIYVSVYSSSCPPTTHNNNRMRLYVMWR